MIVAGTKIFMVDNQLSIKAIKVNHYITKNCGLQKEKIFRTNIL